MSSPGVMLDVFSYKIILHERWIGVVTYFIYLNHKYAKVLGIITRGKGGKVTHQRGWDLS